MCGKESHMEQNTNVNEKVTKSFQLDWARSTGRSDKVISARLDELDLQASSTPGELDTGELDPGELDPGELDPGELDL